MPDRGTRIRWSIRKPWQPANSKTAADAPPGLGVFAADGHAVSVETIRHGDAGGLWLRAGTRCAGPPRCRRDSWIISPKRNERRWRISIDCCRITPARRWKSTNRPAAVWKLAARCAKVAAKDRCCRCSIAPSPRWALGSLADWVANPLADLAAINERLDAVAELVADARACRRSARKTPRHLRHPAIAGPHIHRPSQPARFGARRPNVGCAAGGEGKNHRPAQCAACAIGIGTRSVPRNSGAVGNGARRRLARCKAAKVASSGRAFNAELDGLRELAAGGKQWIARYQAEEAAAHRHSQL